MPGASRRITSIWCETFPPHVSSMAMIPLAPAARTEDLAAMAEGAPFWKTKSLAEMTDSEWESLCDGCGRCCLVKLEDEDDGAIHYTDIGCRLLDGQACRCRDYENRSARVDDCVRLTPQNVRAITWLPPTCGYKLVAEGRDLYWWHPLLSGDSETVHAAGVSVRDRVRFSEEEIPDSELEDHIVKWPGRVPRGKNKQRLR